MPVHKAKFELNAGDVKLRKCGISMFKYDLI